MTQKTKICDRCGKEIEFGKFPAIKKLTSFSGIKTLGFGVFDYINTYGDLCVECSKSFEKWLKQEDTK